LNWQGITLKLVLFFVEVVGKVCKLRLEISRDVTTGWHGYDRRGGVLVQDAYILSNTLSYGHALLLEEIWYEF
jgi:hypothetical protein